MEFKELENKLEELTSFVDFIKMKLDDTLDWDTDFEYSNFLQNKDLMKYFYKFVDENEPLFLKHNKTEAKFKLEFEKNINKKTIKSIIRETPWGTEKFSNDSVFTKSNTLCYKHKSHYNQELHIVIRMEDGYLVKINNDESYTICK